MDRNRYRDSTYRDSTRARTRARTGTVSRARIGIVREHSRYKTMIEVRSITLNKETFRPKTWDLGLISCPDISHYSKFVCYAIS